MTVKKADRPLRSTAEIENREGGLEDAKEKTWKITRPPIGTPSPSEILQGCLRRLWQSSHCSGGSARGERSALYGVLQEIETVRMTSGEDENDEQESLCG